MQAEYEMKVQVIRSQGRAARLFVNIPMPLAAALDLQAGERIRWQVLGRSDLRLVRLAPMLHKPIEQMGGRGVRKLENSELYDNQLRRPEPNRL
jgi:hypothetical protein